MPPKIGSCNEKNVQYKLEALLSFKLADVVALCLILGVNVSKNYTNEYQD